MLQFLVELQRKDATALKQSLLQMLQPIAHLFHGNKSNN